MESTKFSDVEQYDKHLNPITQLFDRPLCGFLESLVHLVPLIEDLNNFGWVSLEFATSLGKKEIEEIAAINIYTREWSGQKKSLYTVMNRYLREPKRDILKPFFPYLQLLITALFKLGVPYEGPVWRGVKADITSQFELGKKLIWWSFSSCTTDMRVLDNPQFLGQKGKRTLFNIHCKKGFNIQQFSSIPQESEILLLPGTYLQVTNKWDAGNGLHIIELKELDPPYEIIKGSTSLRNSLSVVSFPTQPPTSPQPTSIVSTSPVPTSQPLTSIVSTSPVPTSQLISTSPVPTSQLLTSIVSTSPVPTSQLLTSTSPVPSQLLTSIVSTSPVPTSQLLTSTSLTSTSPSLRVVYLLNLTGIWYVANDWDTKSNVLSPAYAMELEISPNGTIKGKTISGSGPRAPTSDFSILGKIVENVIMFDQLDQSKQIVNQCTATLEGDSMNGTWSQLRKTSCLNGKFSATKMVNFEAISGIWSISNNQDLNSPKLNIAYQINITVTKGIVKGESLSGGPSYWPFLVSGWCDGKKIVFSQLSRDKQVVHTCTATIINNCMSGTWVSKKDQRKQGRFEGIKLN